MLCSLQRRLGGRVGVLRLCDPEKLNALSEDMGRQFTQRMAEIRNDSDLRALVLTGEGAAFSAGGDLNWLLERCQDTHENNVKVMRAFYDRFLCVRDTSIPCIAAIQGAAVGAGACLSLAADMRICTPSTRIGFTFSRLGLHPGMGGSKTLPFLVGHARAADLLLTSRMVDGDEALRLGLVNEVVDDHADRSDSNNNDAAADDAAQDRLLDRAIEIAEDIALNAPVAVQETTKTLRAAKFDDGFDTALQREAEAQADCYATRDLLLGIRATQRRQLPDFQGN